MRRFAMPSPFAGTAVCLPQAQDGSNRPRGLGRLQMIDSPEEEGGASRRSAGQNSSQLSLSAWAAGAAPPRP
ncbi:MAG: hypothetical protein V7704_23680, partial [Aurantimonas endophytica]|uniref:hypothetical protein n=1 Tax=Aurantimonas endophytica TaxID=1522175 RepID=UPI0030039A7E